MIKGNCSMWVESLVAKIENTVKEYPDKIFTQSNRIYTCLNPFSYLIVRRKKTNLNDFDGVFIDGITMCIWIQLLWSKKISRLSFDMTSMAKDLFERCNDTNETIYLIGSKQEYIEKSVEVIQSRYPKLNIVGYRDGYFNNKEERDLAIKRIIELNPNYVIVGMGTPLQEDFLVNLKNQGYKGIGFTCGGFIHQTANGLDYYPDWVNKYNLRGFYRQYKEKGIFKRNYDTFILFPIFFIKDTIKSKVRRKNGNK